MHKSHQRSTFWKPTIGMLVIILIGVGAVLWAPRLKSPPARRPVTEQAVKVRVMAVPKLDVVPRIIGYGRVAPERSWEAVAQVAGQVVWMAEALRNGKVSPRGTELLRIEDADYRLVLAQAEAQLQVSGVKKKTARDNLVAAEKNLALLDKEYRRQKDLAGGGMVSQADLEAAERLLLAGGTQMENQQNALALLEAEQRVLVAQRAAAQLNLKRTVVTAPMDVRITQVHIGAAQYANKGQLLFTADGLARAEVEARFSVGILRPLIQGQNLNRQAARGHREHREKTDIPSDATGLKALVRLRTADHKVEWPARVDRVAGSIDPVSQSVGIIAVVDGPYAAASPGSRPPLLRDTFVEVELFTEPITGRIVVPAGALHKGVVYLVNGDSRLELRPIKLAFTVGGYTVITQGLKPGERIVTSDLLTAVEGMLLAPQEDKKGKQRLVQAATRKDPRP